VIDDVIGHHPDIGWRPLVKEFFLRNLASKGYLRPTKWEKGS